MNECNRHNIDDKVVYSQRNRTDVVDKGIHGSRYKVTSVAFHSNAPHLSTASWTNG